MISYVEGAAIGVGKVYNNKLTVNKIGDDKIEVKFN